MKKRSKRILSLVMKVSSRQKTDFFPLFFFLPEFSEIYATLIEMGFETDDIITAYRQCVCPD